MRLKRVQFLDDIQKKKQGQHKDWLASFNVRCMLIVETETKHIFSFSGKAKRNSH